MLCAFGQMILGIGEDKKIRFVEHEKDSIRNERNNAVFNVDNDDTLCDNLVRLLVD
jgi:hypothetical protein